MWKPYLYIFTILMFFIDVSCFGYSDLPFVKSISQHEREPRSDTGPKITDLIVNVTVLNRYAHTDYFIRVVNTASDDNEYHLSIPVPYNAFATDFILSTGGLSYDAQILEMGDEFQPQEGKQVSPTRYSKRFEVTLDMEPKSEATFSLSYEEFLQRENGQYEIITIIKPMQLVENMYVKFEIMESSPLAFVTGPIYNTGDDMVIKLRENFVTENSVRSPNFTIIVAPSEEMQRKVQSCMKKGVGLEGQIIVQYDVERYDDGGELLVDENGYYIHLFGPNEAGVPILAKQIVFAIDTEVSMQGRKLEQLKLAMREILNELNPSDKFNMVFFNWVATVYNLDDGSLVEYPAGQFGKEIQRKGKGKVENIWKVKFPPSVPASPEYIKKANDIFENITLMEGTNYFSALLVALRLVESYCENMDEDKYRVPLIIFITDGIPTVDVLSDNVSSDVMKRNRGRRQAPIYSLSIGNETDRLLLEELSYKNYGRMKHIYEAENSFKQIIDFFKSFSSPLYSRIEFENPVAGENTPKFKFEVHSSGMELKGFGKLDSGENVNVQNFAVNGWTQDGPFSKTPHLKRPVSSLERAWAYLRIKDNLQINDTKSLIEATSMSLKYGFLTSVTEMLVRKPYEDESKRFVAGDKVPDNIMETSTTPEEDLACASLVLNTEDDITTTSTLSRGNQTVSTSQDLPEDRTFGSDESEEESEEIDNGSDIDVSPRNKTSAESQLSEEYSNEADVTNRYKETTASAPNGKPTTEMDQDKPLELDIQVDLVDSLKLLVEGIANGTAPIFDFLDNYLSIDEDLPPTHSSPNSGNSNTIEIETLNQIKRNNVVGINIIDLLKNLYGTSKIGTETGLLNVGKLMEPASKLVRQLVPTIYNLHGLIDVVIKLVGPFDSSDKPRFGPARNAVDGTEELNTNNQEVSGQLGKLLEGMLGKINEDQTVESSFYQLKEAISALLNKLNPNASAKSALDILQDVILDFVKQSGDGETDPSKTIQQILDIIKQFLLEGDRFSSSRTPTLADIEYLIEVLQKVLPKNVSYWPLIECICNWLKRIFKGNETHTVLPTTLTTPFGTTADSPGQSSTRKPISIEDMIKDLIKEIEEKLDPIARLFLPQCSKDMKLTEIFEKLVKHGMVKLISDFPWDQAFNYKAQQRSWVGNSVLKPLMAYKRSIDDIQENLLRSSSQQGSTKNAADVVFKYMLRFIEKVVLESPLGTISNFTSTLLTPMLCDDKNAGSTKPQTSLSSDIATTNLSQTKTRVPTTTEHRITKTTKSNTTEKPKSFIEIIEKFIEDLKKTLSDMRIVDIVKNVGSFFRLLLPECAKNMSFIEVFYKLGTKGLRKLYLRLTSKFTGGGTESIETDEESLHVMGELLNKLLAPLEAVKKPLNKIENFVSNLVSGWDNSTNETSPEEVQIFMNKLLEPLTEINQSNHEIQEFVSELIAPFITSDKWDINSIPASEIDSLLTKLLAPLTANEQAIDKIEEFVSNLISSFMSSDGQNFDVSQVPNEEIKEFYNKLLEPLTGIVHVDDEVLEFLSNVINPFVSKNPKSKEKTRIFAVDQMKYLLDAGISKFLPFLKESQKILDVVINMLDFITKAVTKGFKIGTEAIPFASIAKYISNQLIPVLCDNESESTIEPPITVPPTGTSSVTNEITNESTSEIGTTDNPRSLLEIIEGYIEDLVKGLPNNVIPPIDDVAEEIEPHLRPLLPECSKNMTMSEVLYKLLRNGAPKSIVYLILPFLSNSTNQLLEGIKGTSKFLNYLGKTLINLSKGKNEIVPPSGDEISTEQLLLTNIICDGKTSKEQKSIEDIVEDILADVINELPGTIDDIEEVIDFHLRPFLPNCTDGMKLIDISHKLIHKGIPKFLLYLTSPLVNIGINLNNNILHSILMTHGPPKERMKFISNVISVLNVSLEGDKVKTRFQRSPTSASTKGKLGMVVEYIGRALMKMAKGEEVNILPLDNAADVANFLTPLLCDENGSTSSETTISVLTTESSSNNEIESEDTDCPTGKVWADLLKGLMNLLGSDKAEKIPSKELLKVTEWTMLLSESDNVIEELSETELLKVLSWISKYFKDNNLLEDLSRQQILTAMANEKEFMRNIVFSVPEDHLKGFLQWAVNILENKGVVSLLPNNSDADKILRLADKLLRDTNILSRRSKANTGKVLEWAIEVLQQPTALPTATLKSLLVLLENLIDDNSATRELQYSRLKDLVLWLNKLMPKHTKTINFNELFTWFSKILKRNYLHEYQVNGLFNVILSLLEQQCVYDCLQETVLEKLLLIIVDIVKDNPKMINNLPLEKLKRFVKWLYEMLKLKDGVTKNEDIESLAREDLLEFFWELLDSLKDNKDLTKEEMGISIKELLDLLKYPYDQTSEPSQEITTPIANELSDLLRLLIKIVTEGLANISGFDYKPNINPWLIEMVKDNPFVNALEKGEIIDLIEWMANYTSNILDDLEDTHLESLARILANFLPKFSVKLPQHRLKGIFDLLKTILADSELLEELSFKKLQKIFTTMTAALKDADCVSSLTSKQLQELLSYLGQLLWNFDIVSLLPVSSLEIIVEGFYNSGKNVSEILSKLNEDELQNLFEILHPAYQKVAAEEDLLNLPLDNLVEANIVMLDHLLQNPSLLAEESLLKLVMWIGTMLAENAEFVSALPITLSKNLVSVVTNTIQQIIQEIEIQRDLLHQMLGWFGDILSTSFTKLPKNLVQEIVKWIADLLSEGSLNPLAINTLLAWTLNVLAKEVKILPSFPNELLKEIIQWLIRFFPEESEDFDFNKLLEWLIATVTRDTIALPEYTTMVDLGKEILQQNQNFDKVDKDVLQKVLPWLIDLLKDHSTIPLLNSSELKDLAIFLLDILKLPKRGLETMNLTTIISGALNQLKGKVKTGKLSRQKIEETIMELSKYLSPTTTEVSTASTEATSLATESSTTKVTTTKATTTKTTTTKATTTKATTTKATTTKAPTTKATTSKATTTKATTTKATTTETTTTKATTTETTTVTTRAPGLSLLEWFRWFIKIAGEGLSQIPGYDYEPEINPWLLDLVKDNPLIDLMTVDDLVNLIAYISNYILNISDILENADLASLAKLFANFLNDFTDHLPKDMLNGLFEFLKTIIQDNAFIKKMSSETRNKLFEIVMDLLRDKNFAATLTVRDGDEIISIFGQLLKDKQKRNVNLFSADSLNSIVQWFFTIVKSKPIILEKTLKREVLQDLFNILYRAVDGVSSVPDRLSAWLRKYNRHRYSFLRNLPKDLLVEGIQMILDFLMNNEDLLTSGTLTDIVSWIAQVLADSTFPSDLTSEMKQTLIALVAKAIFEVAQTITIPTHLLEQMIRLFAQLSFTDFPKNISKSIIQWIVHLLSGDEFNLVPTKRLKSLLEWALKVFANEFDTLEKFPMDLLKTIVHWLIRFYDGNKKDFDGNKFLLWSISTVTYKTIIKSQYRILVELLKTMLQEDDILGGVAESVLQKILMWLMELLPNHSTIPDLKKDELIKLGKILQEILISKDNVDITSEEGLKKLLNLLLVKLTKGELSRLDMEILIKELSKYLKIPVKAITTTVRTSTTSKRRWTVAPETTTEERIIIPRRMTKEGNSHTYPENKAKLMKLVNKIGAISNSAETSKFWGLFTKNPDKSAPFFALSSDYYLESSTKAGAEEDLARIQRPILGPNDFRLNF